MYRILSSNALGLIIAFPFLLAGAVTSQSIPGIFLLVIGVVLTWASLFHFYKLWRFNRRFPPPGKFVEVDGILMHYLAEGPQSSAPTVVWIPGSHDSGLEMWGLHKALSAHNRSIIFDRIGCGWSGLNNKPRTPFIEAAELYGLLEQIGETAPVVIAGHSLGGMQATSFAQRYPDKTAGLVLIDAGVADNFAYVSKFRGPKNIPGDSLLLSLKAAFGLLWFGLPKEDPEKYNQSDLGQMSLGIMAQPKSHTGWVYTLNAVFDDLLGLVQMPEALGDIPLFALIPNGHDGAEREGVRKALPDFTDLQIDNLMAMRQRGRLANAKLSRRGQLRIAPDDTTHSLHEEAPEFVLEQIQEMLQLVMAKGAG